MLGMGVIMAICCLGVVVILGLAPAITLPGAFAGVILWVAAMTGVHWLYMSKTGHNHHM
ncbi:MAG: hypothetical protein ACE5EF_03645 [Dehalococcoidia bacterium]